MPRAGMSILARSMYFALDYLLRASIYLTMSNEKAPTETPISTGAVLCTAEAAQGDTSIIRLSTVELNRRFHNDVPQLPL